jgi:hypothetical protein
MGDTLSVAVGLASHSLAMEIVEIGDLLLYNETSRMRPQRPSWLDLLGVGCSSSKVEGCSHA